MRSAIGPRRRSIVQAVSSRPAKASEPSSIAARAIVRPDALGIPAPAGGSQGRRGTLRRPQVRVRRVTPAAMPATRARPVARAAETSRCWAANERLVRSASSCAARASPANRVRRIASRRPTWSSRLARVQRVCASSKRRERLGAQTAGGGGLRSDQRQFGCGEAAERRGARPRQAGPGTRGGRP